MHALLSPAETAALIRSGAALALAGSHRTLGRLPRGRWIGGTSHYFVSDQGGLKTDDHIFVTDLSRLGDVAFSIYSAETIADIASHGPDQGFSLLILPAASPVLQRFAQHGQSAFALLKPVVGWVAGTDLAVPSGARAQVIDGRDGTLFHDAALAAHVILPPGRVAAIAIVNPFDARPDSPILRFELGGFGATDCFIDGHRTRLADFLIAHRYHGGRLPLIGDFSGAAINVSIKSVDPVSGVVEFFGPLFPGIDYRLAQPVENFAANFAARTHHLRGTEVAFGCNCILNYLYGELEGHAAVHPPGPITFGEVGHQLLNQTFVSLTIH